jgi:YgiT-type zinc finger domain-containing protein
MLHIKTCPTCGSKRIRVVRKDYHGRYKGKAYVARDVEYHECPQCGEKLFGSEAMKKIESSRPQPRRRVKAA